MTCVDLHHLIPDGGKQCENLLWYEIFDVVKQNSTTAFEGSPQDDAMEKLLRSRSKRK